MNPRITTPLMLSLPLLALLAPLAGCATARRVVYEKPGVAQAERQRDENECLRAAIGTDEPARLLAPYTVDREAYARCMEARGYTRKS